MTNERYYFAVNVDADSEFIQLIATDPDMGTCLRKAEERLPGKECFVFNVVDLCFPHQELVREAFYIYLNKMQVPQIEHASIWNLMVLNASAMILEAFEGRRHRQADTNSPGEGEGGPGENKTK